MKKVFTFIVVCLTTISTWAYDVEVDGIYYNLIEKAKTAEVTYKTTSYKSYSGSVTIPEAIVSNDVTYSVTSIGDYAFKTCTGLTSVTIPNSVTSIGSEAFYYCIGLSKVNISDLASWVKISFSGSDASPLFYAHHLYLNDVEVKDLVIPHSVTSIESYSFQNGTGLNSVTIPNSVTSIGTSAFAECTGLTSVTIPNSVTNMGDYAFCECSGLTSVTISNSVTGIGTSAFKNCTGLTSVTIPNSVTSIKNWAFDGCSGIKTVSIGTGVKNIYYMAFEGCKNLETVTCNAEEVPKMYTDVFKDCYVSYATLKVPSVSVELYNAADQWKEFGTIVDITKCATPTISLKDGKVVATSGTEGATCNVSYELKNTNDVLSLEVTAYATADGYSQSETATATYPLTIGESGDVNGDGTVNIVDVNSLVNKLLGK